MKYKLKYKIISILSIIFITLAITVSSIASYAAQPTDIRNYYASNTDYTIPRSGLYYIECWGAKGGDDASQGGLGGYQSGYFRLNKGDVIHIGCGQLGVSIWNSAAYNTWGGGAGTGSTSGSGGGASWVSIGTYRGNLPNYANTYTNEVLIIAGGGGGASCGVGGAPGGGYGCGNNGVFGQGSWGHGDGGGGGGGFRGGTQGSDNSTRAQGGSSWVNTSLRNGQAGVYQGGVNGGAGRVQISLMSYSIIFNKNKPAQTKNVVQGVMEDQVMIPGIPDRLKNNKYTLEGYIFKGYNSKPDGTGTWYYDGDYVIDN